MAGRGSGLAGSQADGRLPCSRARRPGRWRGRGSRAWAKLTRSSLVSAPDVQGSGGFKANPRNFLSCHLLYKIRTPKGRVPPLAPANLEAFNTAE